MNTLELVPAEPQHVSEIGRICYEAFKEVQEGHGFSPDFPPVDLARQVLGMLVERDDFYGVVALRDGQPVGSNFLSLTGPVAGVGPITIDCSCGASTSPGRFDDNGAILGARDSTGQNLFRAAKVLALDETPFRNPEERVRPTTSMGAGK